MRTLIALIFGALLFASPAFAWNSASCPAGTFDTVGWSFPQPGFSTVHNEGPAIAADTSLGPVTPRYFYQVPANTTQGTLITTIRDVGYPWDINLYDANGVYAWITGLGATFTDPTAFVEYPQDVGFHTPAIMYPRCAPYGQPGWVQSIGTTPLKVSPGASNCASSIIPFPDISASVWGPNTMTWGGNIPPNSPTMIYVHVYTAPTGQAVEYFYYVEGYGQVWWNWYINGVYQGGSEANTQTAGGMPAYVFPCTP